MKAGKEKLTKDMDITDIIITMSEGNPGAVTLLAQMANDTSKFLYTIFLCDSLDIRGTKLYTLYSDCSDKDIKKFINTITLLGYKIFPEEQIEDNFRLVRSIPFIDDNIEIANIPKNFPENFFPGHPKWNAFCEKTKESFTNRLNDALEQQKDFIPPRPSKK